MNKQLPDSWKQLVFREIAKPVRRTIFVTENEQYRTMGVKWWGEGAYERETKFGHEIKANKLYRVCINDLVINRIWVRHGSSGIVDEVLDGCVVSQDFPTFELDLGRASTAWLRYMFKTKWFWEECEVKSRGTSGRQRIDPEEYLDIEIPLPLLNEQQRIVKKIISVEQRIAQIRGLQEETERDTYGILLGAYTHITQNAPHKPMVEVAPLVRRAVDVEADREYPELGIRSFGKGTFHKPAIKGSDLGSKRIYWIEAGDLLFSNVFAWEGAVAVTQPEDSGRVGSHRFISRVPKPGIVTATFLCFHFATEGGLQQLRDASPGSAGRNRTLSLQTLDTIQVPVPSYESQLWFDELHNRLDALRKEQTKVQKELEALFPSVLDKAFRGEL